jgi:multisubunit Na+/H+ antiporter MnhB subunit
MMLVDTVVLVVYHSILVLSLYFAFAGHNQPGGGFVGGLVAGAAISLRYIAGGLPAVRAALPIGPYTALGTGLLISTLCATVPVLLGGGVLEHATLSLTLPAIGTMKATTALPFDLGVYLLVVGVTLAAFEAFGGDDDMPAEHEPVDGGTT